MKQPGIATALNEWSRYVEGSVPLGDRLAQKLTDPSVARRPELTKVPLDTHKRTYGEHQAAFRKISGGARSGFIPSTFSVAS